MRKPLNLLAVLIGLGVGVVLIVRSTTPPRGTHSTGSGPHPASSADDSLSRIRTGTPSDQPIARQCEGPAGADAPSKKEEGGSSTGPQAIDPEFRDFLFHLDHVCHSGGDILATVARLEARAAVLGTLTVPQLSDLLRNIKNEEALALVLLVLARTYPASFRAIQPDFIGDGSMEVRVACCWGEVIERCEGPITEAAHEAFWKEAYGLLLILCQAPVEAQRDLVMHVRPAEDPSVVASLVRSMTTSPDPALRNLCALYLRSSPHNEAVSGAYREVLAHDASPLVRETTARLLSMNRSAETLNALRSAIETDADEQVRAQAMEAIGEGGAPEIVQYLVDRYSSALTAGELRAIIAGASQSPLPAHTQFLARVVQGGDCPAVRGSAIKALARRPRDPLAISTVVGALSLPDEFLRTVAAASLGEMGDPSAIAPLERVAETDPVHYVREVARESIAELRK